MANKPKYKKAEFEKAIKGSRGLKSVVYGRIGCDSKTLERYLETYPELKENLKDERVTMDDFAESKLFELVKEKNPAVCIFYAKTRMQRRGYVEKHQHEVTGKDGSAIVINYKPEKK